MVLKKYSLCSGNFSLFVYRPLHCPSHGMQAQGTRGKVVCWPDDDYWTSTHGWKFAGEYLRVFYCPCTHCDASYPPKAGVTSSQESGSASGFAEVKKEARPACRAIYPATCLKRFAILEEGELQNIFLVGDSMTHQQVLQLCGRGRSRRCNYCYPGVGIDNIMAALDEITADVTNNSLSCIQVQTTSSRHVPRVYWLSKVRLFSSTRLFRRILSIQEYCQGCQ